MKCQEYIDAVWSYGAYGEKAFSIYSINGDEKQENIRLAWSDIESALNSGLNNDETDEEDDDSLLECWYDDFRRL